MVRTVRLRIWSCFQARKGSAAFTHEEFIICEKRCFPPVIHDKFLETGLPDQRATVLRLHSRFHVYNKYALSTADAPGTAALKQGRALLC